MKKIGILLLSMFCCLACSHGPVTKWESSASSDAEALYRRALHELETGYYSEAVTLFGSLKLKYPYATKWATLADLGIADGYFKDQQYSTAAQSYQDFIKAYPTHPQIPYAMFKTAECYYESMPSSLFILPPASQRELVTVRKAQNAFRLFIARFPKDSHVEEAKKQLDIVETRLARHELYAAEYYFKEGYYLGALNRAKYLLENYPSSQLAAKAIILAANSLIKLKNPVEAKGMLKDLLERYPDSTESQEAKSWMNRNPKIPDLG